MKASALKYAILSTAATLTILILSLVPFHALLTVWAASNFGHYTALRLWKEVLVLVIFVGILYLLITDHKIRTHTLTRRLVWLIIGYVGLQGLIGLLAYHEHHVTLKALAYGWLVDLRFLGFFLLTWAVALRTSRLRANWQRLVLWPAAVVVVFGLLQIFVLPYDALRHFGYSPQTIDAFETINSNHNFIRITSTLRGANPLGAYLLIPITTLTVLLLNKWRNYRLLGFLVAGLLVLAFSFSRSAFIGVILSASLAIWLGARTNLARKHLAYGLSALVLLAIVGAFSLHRSTYLENIVLHTQTHSTVRTSSNQGHVSSLQTGLKDIVHEPFGRGPGTAGPASTYNHDKTRIAENYFLQVGQEVGVIGLALFLLINAGVGYLLWSRRSDPLALSLFASLIGISFVNLLSHAWTDDTLAYLWWGLAGIAMATQVGAKDADAEDS